MSASDSAEAFLIAMLAIFTIPYLVWRIARTDYYAPLVVVQIVVGILLGPGVLGVYLPRIYGGIFGSDVMRALNGLAWWAVMVFVWTAGIELDIRQPWQQWRDTSITAVLALGMPLLCRGVVAACMLAFSGWIGPAAAPWQFVVGIGMACAVTALPILVLFMERLEMLRRPLGQRVLRYASFDDIAIWRDILLSLPAIIASPAFHPGATLSPPWRFITQRNIVMPIRSKASGSLSLVEVSRPRI